jgi:Domain of unknown function (DUF4157)
MTRAFATSTNSEGVADEKKSAVRAPPTSREPVHQISPSNGPQIQRQSSCACGGGCPRCQAKHIESAGNPHISSRADPHERQANEIADQVLRMDEPDSVPSPVNLHPSPAASNEPKRSIQTKAAPQAGGGPDAQAAVSATQRDGAPLSAETRSYFEPRFGVDFSHVRVHADADAASAAGGIQARAYTVGENIVFGSGEYSPGSNEGKRILAHELTHVVQQTSPDTRPAPMIQRFESDEHQHLGDVATGSAGYDVGGGMYDPFKLTHGDILALSGDVFEPDELFSLAKIKGKHGKMVGTRDEIIWALRDPRIWEMRKATQGPYAGKKDPRFETGGDYDNWIFSEDVKNAVFNRYRKLGAKNASHFVSPIGRDAGGAPIPASDSAGSQYHSLHENTVSMAHFGAILKHGLPEEMAREAAAQHFLTDAFSAGHLRTPIKAIRDHWSKKYPMFWFNLYHKIALDTAIEMTSGTPITAHFGYTQILAAVQKMVPDLPSVTLGDLIGSVFHDADNEQGVKLVGGGKVMGDAHLDQATQDLAVAAIQAGNLDVKIAYQLGEVRQEPLRDAELFAKVQELNGGANGKFAPELAMPTPDLKAEPTQNWMADNIESLWNQPFLGDRKFSGGKDVSWTVGQEITKRVQGGSIGNQLESLGQSFPESESGLHPRAAYLKGFVKNLQKDPKAGVLDIISWAPHGMDTGDAATETVNELQQTQREAAALESKKDRTKKEDEELERKRNVDLAHLNVDQRIKLVNELLNQDTGEGTAAHQEMIITIFESAPAAERPTIYLKIEGHFWEGSFKHGVKGRDRLYRVMSIDRLERFQNLINGISTK